MQMHVVPSPHQLNHFFDTHPSHPQSNHIHTNGVLPSDGIAMNPYQQGQPPPYHPNQYQHPQQQQQQQQPQYSHPGYAQQHPQHQTILPPLSASMGMPQVLPPPIHTHPGQVGHYVPQSHHYGAPPPHHMAPPMAQPQQPQRRPVELSKTGDDGTYRYTLVVEQQPQRARMCGFGDKDRRPITPPPCIRLIIERMSNGEPIKASEVDGTFFVLQVDLWSDDAQREVNIVRSSSTSPAVSISTATTTSYPPTPDRPLAGAMMYPGYGGNMGGHYGQMQYPGTPMPMQSSSSQSGVCHRNLIGSLTVNAALLQDTNQDESYWFVLQDLSVRTEGWFRLKMNFIDLGKRNGSSELNRGKAKVLAHVFSDKFQVYSAKKFPGVIESTPLSKCFAGQGIKIPIRKDGRAEAKDEDDD